MALGVENHPIERFGERVGWLIANLDCTAAWPGGVRNKTQLWRAIAAETSLDSTETYRTWKRCTSPKDNYPVPDVIVRGVLKIYGDIPRAILIARRFDEFMAYADSITQSRTRWIDATKHLAKNRAALAVLGKNFYKQADETPGFPLIAKKQWLLEKPLLLSERSSVSIYDPMIRELESRRLDNLNTDYISLRSRLVPSGAPAPTDGDSYRLLDVQVKKRGLQFTFGPSGYFRYVNSLEATAVELADFALRHPGEHMPAFEKPRVPSKAIFDFKSRSAVAGISCLLMIKNYSANNYSDEKRAMANKFVLHRRGENTLEAQNTVHVLPAGGHQPLAENFGDDREVEIWRTIVREFCEELFNRQEAAELRRHGEVFLDLPAVKPYVDRFFRDGAAQIYLLGMGVDPVTTKPEILVAIVADWAKAARRMEKLKIEENYEGRAYLLDLTQANLKREAELPRPATPALLPAGKACLLLAHRHYAHLMGPAAI